MARLVRHDMGMAARRQTDNILADGDVVGIACALYDRFGTCGRDKAERQDGGGQQSAGQHTMHDCSSSTPSQPT